MAEVTASRTLVKSHPELWTECSNARSLARHLGAFGQIRITSLEPETAVAWEGERASGTVRLESSGWGTRVVLTATPAPSHEAAAGEAGASARPPDSGVGEPSRVDEVPAGAESSLPAELPSPHQPGPPQASRPGLFARLRARWRRRRRAWAGIAPAASAREPPMPSARSSLSAGEPSASSSKPTPVPSSSGSDAASARVDPALALTAALDSLGRAHHRPFSRR